MRLRRILIALLALQILLGIVTWWPQDRSGGSARALIDIPSAEFTRIRIARKPAADAEPAWLELVREPQGWVVASEGGYPAEEAKVEGLIERLRGIEVRTPIGTRPSHHNGLKVGELDYGRRIAFEAGERQGELIVGAASRNGVNVRLADDDDVFAVSGLSEWSLRDDAASYRREAYVEVAEPGLTAIAIRNAKGHIDLTREAGEGEDGATWRVTEGQAGIAEGRTLSQRAVSELIGKLGRLRVVEPVGSEVLPEHGLDGGVRIGWTLMADNASAGGGYTVGADSGPNVFVKSDNSPFVVKVAKSAVQPLIDVAMSDLLEPETE